MGWAGAPRALAGPARPPGHADGDLANWGIQPRLGELRRSRGGGHEEAVDRAVWPGFRGHDLAGNRDLARHQTLHTHARDVASREHTAHASPGNQADHIPGRAGMEYEEIVAVVRQASGGIGSEAADRALQATLQTLAERLPRGQARHIVPELPAELKPWIYTETDDEGVDIDELLVRVARC